MTSSSAVHASAVRSQLVLARHSAASASLAGAVLAVLPAVYAVSLVPALAGTWNPVEYAVLALAFYLASVALAAVDEHYLRASGLARAATAYWSLLGIAPYLVARTRQLIAADRSGLASLWVAIAATSVSALVLALVLLAA